VKVVARLESVVARLEKALAERDEMVAERDGRIAELERLLDDARRSGKRQAAPFRRRDEPVDEPARPGRKSGGEHGRHGHRMAPPDADRTLHAPLGGCCPDCGGEIEHVGDAEQFQTDLPALPPPATTRFRVAVGRCKNCGRRVQGRHGEQTSDALGAAGAQIGPNAKAWAAWLHYSLGVPFAKIARLFAERLGLSVTAGALCQAAQSTSTDLVPVNNEIRRRVNNSPVVAADETGWRIGGAPAWVWVATTDQVTYYNVAHGRGFAEATEVIDANFAGTIVRDGWAAYRQYEQATHQSCLAHLTRRCDELIEDLPGWARSTPRQVRDILGQALDVKDLAPEVRTKVIEDLTERIELLGEQAHPHDENRKLVKHLLVEKDALFTFLADPTVDSTSWRAEQAVRPTTVTRKVCGGNRTDRGAETQSRMMTLFRTATQQGIDAVDYLVNLARAPDPGAVPFFA
jgi:transposase